MSKSNYRRCVRLGVTGRNTNTCFPASIDKLLPGQRIDPDLYRDYDDLMVRYDDLPSRQKNPHLRRMFRALAEHISADEFHFVRVGSRPELKDIVADSLRESEQVILHLRATALETHAVGLETFDRRRRQFCLTSTYVPHALRGIVTLDQIYPYLDYSKEKDSVMYPFSNANVTLVPVE